MIATWTWICTKITHPPLPMNYWQIKALMFGSKWLFKPSGVALLPKHTVISQKWSELRLQVSYRHEWRGWRRTVSRLDRGWGALFPRLLTSSSWDSSDPNGQSLPPHTDAWHLCVFWCLWCCASEGELCNVTEREPMKFLPISSGMMKVEQQLCSLCLHILVFTVAVLIIFLQYKSSQTMLQKYGEK